MLIFTLTNCMQTEGSNNKLHSEYMYRKKSFHFNQNNLNIFVLCRYSLAFIFCLFKIYEQPNDRINITFKEVHFFKYIRIKNEHNISTI